MILSWKYGPAEKSAEPDFSFWGGITGRIFPIRSCFPQSRRRMLYMYRMTGTENRQKRERDRNV